METKLEALTPSSLSSVKFRTARDEQDFVTWAVSNPQISPRRFSIREIGERDAPTMADLETERVITQAELLVVYPKRYGLYGQDNARDAYDMAETDLTLLDGISGIGIANSGGYVSGQHASIRVESGIDDDATAPVFFLRAVFEVHFQQAVSS